MSEVDLETRVENLEKLAVELAPLPQEVRRHGVEILQLRTDMNSGFSAIRQELSEVRQELSEVRQDVSGLKQDVSGLKRDVSGLKQDVSGLKRDVSGLKQDVSKLQQEMSGIRQDMSEQARETAGHFLDTQRQMRVLHEDVIERISRIGKG